MNARRAHILRVYLSKSCFQQGITQSNRKKFRGARGKTSGQKEAATRRSELVITAAPIRRMARPALSRGRLPGWFKMPVLGKLKLCGDLGLKTCG